MRTASSDDDVPHLAVHPPLVVRIWHLVPSQAHWTGRKSGRLEGTIRCVL